MATSIKAPIQWAHQSEDKQNELSFYGRFVSFTETQSQNKTLWFLISLMFQGVFFLPLPAVLIYYYNAPVFILGITLILFFSNIIAGMGGASIKVIVQLLAASFIIHTLMTLICILV
jgi:membrane protein insertase Oxa1/YidC/SpoIIIJ